MKKKNTKKMENKIKNYYRIHHTVMEDFFLRSKIHSLRTCGWLFHLHYQERRFVCHLQKDETEIFLSYEILYEIIIEISRRRINF